MKAIFVKEWRQAHLLPWAGLLLSALIMVLYVVWVAWYAQTQSDVEDMYGFCAFLMLIACIPLVLVAGSGLISSETGTGSITYLLGLPISRSRIWWGKTLAGFTLTLVTVLLLIVPASVVIFGIGKAVLSTIIVFLPDIFIWGLYAYSVILFCSTLFARSLSVVLLAPLLVGLLLVFSQALRPLGLAPLQYDDIIDGTLWALLLTVVFFFASWWTFTRGELLEARRARLALPIVIGGIVLIVVPMKMVTEWEQRYDRRGVDYIESAFMPLYGRYAQLRIAGDSAPYTRVSTEWHEGGPARSRHTVLVDVTTGKEILWDGEDQPYTSPDGRFAYVTKSIDTELFRTHTQLWDLATRRHLSDITLPFFHDERGLAVEGMMWSRDGQWMAAPETKRGQTDAKGETIYSKITLVVMAPNGSHRREMLLREIRQHEQDGYEVISPTDISAWRWGPSGHTLYLVENGSDLIRYSPDTETRTVLWRRPDGIPKNAQVRLSVQLAIAPNEQRFAIRIVDRYPVEMQQQGEEPLPTTYHTWVVGLDGPQAKTVAHLQDTMETFPGLTWSGDSRTLFYGVNARWTEGQTAAVPIAANDKLRVRSAWQSILPFRGGALLIDSNTQAPYLLGVRGRLQTFEEKYQLPGMVTFVGLDRQGRAILLQNGVKMISLDPANGAVTPLYP